MNLAPIVLFVYNRPWHTRQTIEALQRNLLASQSVLYVYSDAPKRDSDDTLVQEVRTYLKSLTGFQEVIVVENQSNKGLAANVIDGVTTIVNRFGKVIVLEDDLLTAPYFLSFMNKALDLYEKEDRVGNVHGHCWHLSAKVPETFFIRFANSWGWGTWSRAWSLFEPDGRKLLAELETRQLTKEFDFGGAYPFTRMLRRQIAGVNNSWAIRWNASLFLKGKLSLNVGRSLVQNIGFDGSGTNCREESIFRNELTSRPIEIDEHQTVQECTYAREIVAKMYRKENSWIAKAKRRLQEVLNSVIILMHKK